MFDDCGPREKWLWRVVVTAALAGFVFRRHRDRSLHDRAWTPSQRFRRDAELAPRTRPLMRTIYQSPWFWLAVFAAAMAGEYVPQIFGGVQ